MPTTLVGCLSDRVFRATNVVTSCNSRRTNFWGACPAVSSIRKQRVCLEVQANSLPGNMATA
eukprot:2593951-Heterocapsa_arctica.AAC.1